jgi:16S rRNA (cytidine1402-2'-O)-methyltransferase
MKPKLFLVSIPIGNINDITLRALETLKTVDFIICEEFKEARRFLSEYNIQKELTSLNEHNEEESSREIIKKLKSGKSAALISDCGTPLFSDPGHLLVEFCIRSGIEIIPIPGANSLLPALIGSGLDFEKFYYRGWLSPKKDIRRKELINLKKIKEVIVILDTPYRLVQLLTDVSKTFGQRQKIVVAFNISMKDEKYFRGSVSDILKKISQPRLKGEFVLLIDNKDIRKRK